MRGAVSARLVCATLAAAAVSGTDAVGNVTLAIPRDADAGPVLRLQGAVEQGRDKPSSGPINSIREVFGALEACWAPPNLDQSRPGMEITVMLSFSRKGEILGRPRITYESPGASPDERLSYRVAMAEALRRCNPLPFTDALGNALAGRPMTIRFTDQRKLKQAENHQ